MIYFIQYSDVRKGKFWYFVVYILYLTSSQYKTKIITPNSLDKPTMHTFLICTIKFHKAYLYLLYPLAACTIVLIDTKNFTKFSNFRNSLETLKSRVTKLIHFYTFSSKFSLFSVNFSAKFTSAIKLCNYILDAFYITVLNKRLIQIFLQKF